LAELWRFALASATSTKPRFSGEKSANPLARRDLPLSEGSFRSDHRSLAYAASGGQVLGSVASKGSGPIDDRGPTLPAGHLRRAATLFGCNRGDFSAGDTDKFDLSGCFSAPALTAAITMIGL
jgi:hypothetical protein